MLCRSIVPLVALLTFVAGCEGDRALDPSPDGTGLSLARSSAAQLAPPSNVVVVASSSISQLTIQWQDNSSKETAFEVHRSAAGATGSFFLVATTRQNALSVLDSGLSAATQYCYKVRALQVSVKTSGSSAFSDVSCGMTPSPPPPPPPPPVPQPSPASQTSVRPLTSSSVLVQWTAIGLYFRIESSIDGGASWTVAGTAYNERFFIHSAQTEQRVCYRVVTYDGSVDAPPSNTDCTIPPASATNIVATQVDAETIELRWSDNSSIEEGYEVWFASIQYSCTGEHSGAWEGEERLVALPPDSTTYRTRGLLGQDACAYSSWIEIRTIRDGGYSSAIYVIDP